MVQKNLLSPLFRMEPGLFQNAISGWGATENWFSTVFSQQINALFCVSTKIKMRTELILFVLLYKILFIFPRQNLFR